MYHFFSRWNEGNILTLSYFQVSLLSPVKSAQMESLWQDNWVCNSVVNITALENVLNLLKLWILSTYHGWNFVLYTVRVAWSNTQVSKSLPGSASLSSSYTYHSNIFLCLYGRIPFRIYVKKIDLADSQILIYPTLLLSLSFTLSFISLKVDLKIQLPIKWHFRLPKLIRNYSPFLSLIKMNSIK